jgi:hypothetical protein
MQLGFNKKAGHDHEAMIGISQLRGQINTRMESAYKRLDPKAAFNQASRGSEESMIGSLLFGMLVWGSFFQGLEMGLENMYGEDMEAFSTMADPTLCAAFDGLSMVWDDKANKNRKRKLNDYPEGRRDDPIFDRPLNRRFNLVSANDNSRFTRDAQAEIACMSEMLDQLSDMEAEGVHMIRLDTKEAVYDRLKEIRDASRYDAVVTRFTAPVRKMA